MKEILHFLSEAKYSSFIIKIVIMTLNLIVFIVLALFIGV